MLPALNGHRGRRAGFTLVEAVLTLSLLATITGSFVALMRRTTTLAEISSIEYELAEDALAVLAAVGRDLGRSGFVDLGGEDFPRFFAAGEAADEVFQHAAPHAFADTEPLAGGPVEIEFPLPADADDDGWPDHGPDHSVDWEAVTVAYLVEPRPDGRNALVRQTGEGARRVLSRDVADLVFESPAATGFAIPLDSVRVRLALRRVGPDGTVYSHAAEQVVSLMNGWMAP